MSIQDLKEALKKLAETMPDNEDGGNQGVNNVYPNPTDRPKGNIDAPWGNSPGEPVQHGTAAKGEFFEGREALLDRIVDGMPEYSAEAKGVIGQAFETKNFESHSPLLTRGGKSKHAETLSQKVLRVIGHR